MHKIKKAIDAIGYEILLLLLLLFSFLICHGPICLKSDTSNLSIRDWFLNTLKFYVLQDLGQWKSSLWGILSLTTLGFGKPHIHGFTLLATIFLSYMQWCILISIKNFSEEPSNLRHGGFSNLRIPYGLLTCSHTWYMRFNLLGWWFVSKRETCLMALHGDSLLNISKFSSFARCKLIVF